MLIDLKFRTQLLMSYSVILSFMLGIALVVFFSIKSLEDDQDWVNHSYDALAKAAEIETIAIDMETGMRGYLLAGKSEFLSPYEKGDKVFHEQVKSLISFVEDNPEQMSLLEEIMATIDEWHSEVTKPVIALRAEIGDGKSMNDMADVIKEAKGKQYFDKFRGHINTFIEREKESVKKSHNKLKSSTNTQDLKQLEELEIHSYRAITMAQSLLAAAVDMETGMRGFLLSGQEHFLDPYKEGSVRFHQLLEELSRFVADNTLQVSTLAGSQTIIDSWISEVVVSQIELRREIGDAKTMDDMADLVGEAKGKVYFDKFRGQIQRFRDRELILLAQRKESLADTESLVTRTTIFGTLLAIFVGLGIAFRLTTRIVSQLGGEPAYIAEIARKVSNGDLNFELKGDESAQGILAEMKQMMVTLKDKTNLAQKIAAGELDQVAKLASDKDVLGLALKEMLSNLNSVANQADALASGDFTKEVVIKSDKDRLGTALHEMKSQINERNASLSMSLNLNQGIVNTAVDGIISIKGDGTILSVNSATERMFKYSAKALIGKNIKMLMPEPFHSEHDDYLSRYKSTGEKTIIGKGREVVAKCSDGSTFPIYLSIGEVKQGEEVMYTGFIRDITIEKQYEQELKESNDDLLKQNELKSRVSIINELTQGASELGAMADSIISALAEMMLAGHGVLYTCGEEGDDLSLSGSYAFKKRKAILSIIPLGEGLVGQCAKEKKTILLTKVPGDYIQINSGLGESSPMNVLVVPVLFEDELMGVIELATFQTFSDEQVEVIELICSNLGIVINNLKSQQRTQTLLLETQRQAEELQAQQEELKSSNESLMEQTQLLKTSEEELRQQSEELKVSNEELEEKQVFLKRQKDEIEAAKVDLTIKANELALASKYKSEFLANMSHELRTPLNSLLLLAKGLADNNSQHLDETEVEDAKVIFDGGNNLLCLINDIMDLSKVEAGKLSIHIEEVNLSVLSRNLKQVFDPIAKSRGLEFIINLDKKLPRIITSDGQRVEQVLRNLLSNAFKFTENGSVSLNIGYVRADTQFSHSSLDANKALSLAVVDTGIGIPSDKLQAIFEAFQQQDGSTSRKYGGTGLGLTIAREMTRLLGGEIQLESSPSEGSTFTLYLPSKFDSDGVEPESHGDNETILSEVKYSTLIDEPDSLLKKSGSSSAEVVKHDPSIQIHPEFIPDDRKNLLEGDRSLLIVDDDKVFAKILRDHARENGYKCLVAGDGRTGIYLAQEYQPDGIILDIMLPDIDGHKVLEQLKFSLKTRHIPVEIISAHSDDKNSALVQGAIGLQTKPVSQEQLLTVFDEIRDFSASELRHVLVVEDDIANQTSIIRLLENSDIDIKCVDNGSQGVDEIMSGQYDCVILDLGLPDFSGFEVLKRIDASELTRVPPVIIYTGKEITDEEQDELNKYSSTIVIKGVGSAERLLDDISLFLHDIESRFCASSQKTIHMLHDEDSMLKGRKVLLADDDMRNTYALSKKLIEIGFDVEMAYNGKEALEQLEQDKNFELVLMDTMMPEMDGYEATQKIRALSHYKHIPIIALTAKAMPEDREKSLQAGASEYLTKPIDFDKLLSIMRIWLFRN
ncbi:CHASE3 domain-containing protein [Shewanella eurypsychrophilus]|uniref:histidine kinase n=1 Tax=Shewanella eurypsychrophilus TaxID=2593656 RepID=A0ABX6V5Z0_9GAMM|nr:MULTISPECIES: CHASE3 domain-containing protein [Shewanella]QFU22538.1 response regulator [Shewanella sp. YLB-09]QPG57826.1 CHASE3 domain-containing protein [Shewanella eurypsychrophilus]